MLVFIMSIIINNNLQHNKNSITLSSIPIVIARNNALVINMLSNFVKITIYNIKIF